MSDELRVVRVLEQDTPDLWRYIVMEGDGPRARHYACEVSATEARHSRDAQIGGSPRDCYVRARVWADKQARIMARHAFADSPLSSRRTTP